MRVWAGIFIGLCAVVPVYAMAAPAQTIELTDAQALQIANIMVNAGDLDNAQNLLNDILQSENVDIRTHAVFQLGRVAMGRGEYKTAKKYFLTILKWHPELTSVRLELAYCYFLASEYASADSNFRLVLGDKSLPPETAQRVRVFINLVRQKKTWSVDAGLSIVPDTNINYATGQSQECIDFGFGPMCRKLESKNSGIGVRYNLGGNYYLRLGDRFSIRNTVSFNALDFSTGRYDDYNLYAATGPRYVLGFGEISLQPFVQAHWYGGEYYNTVPGVRTDLELDIWTRLSVGTGVAFNRTIYANKNINDTWGGHEISAYIQPVYYLNNKSFILTSLSYADNTTRVKSYGNRGFTYSVGYFTELPFTLSIYTRLDISKNKYKDGQFFIMPDYTMQKFTRHDMDYRLFARISSRYFETKRLYPAISYTYSNRHSNAPAYEYEKHRIEAEISYKF